MQNSNDNCEVKERPRQVPENGAEVSDPTFRKFHYTLLQPAFGEHISVPLVKSIMQSILRKANSRRNNSSGSLAYVNNLRNQILYVHRLNMKAFELSSCYPYSDFSQLLCKYVLVECQILNKNPHFPAKRKLQIQHRTLRLLRFIHSEYFECIITPKRKDIAQISAKPIFDIFVELKCNPQANFELLESMTILLLKAIGLYEKVKTSMNQQRSSEDGPDANLAIFATNVIEKYTHLEQPGAPSARVTPADDTNNQNAIPLADLQQGTNSSDIDQLGSRNVECENQTNNKKCGDKKETSQTRRVEVEDNSLINLSKCSRLAKIDALIDLAKKKNANVEDHPVPKSSNRVMEKFRRKKGVVKLFSSPQVIDEIDLTDDTKKSENRTTNSTCLPASRAITTNTTTSKLFSKINCLGAIDALIDSRKPSIKGDSQSVDLKKNKEIVCGEIDLTNNTEKKCQKISNSLSPTNVLPQITDATTSDSSGSRNDLAQATIATTINSLCSANALPQKTNTTTKKIFSKTNCLDAIDTLIDSRKQTVKGNSQKKKKRKDHALKRITAPSTSNIVPESGSSNNNSSVPTLLDNPTANYAEKSCSPVRENISSEEILKDVEKSSSIPVNNSTDDKESLSLKTNESRLVDRAEEIVKSAVESTFQSSDEKFCAVTEKSVAEVKSVTKNSNINNDEPQKLVNNVAECKIKQPIIQINDCQMFNNCNRNYKKTYIKHYLREQDNKKKTEDLLLQQKVQKVLEITDLPIVAKEEGKENSTVILGVEKNHVQAKERNETTQDKSKSSKNKINILSEDNQVEVITSKCLPENSRESSNSEIIENPPSFQIGGEKSERLSTELEVLKDAVERFVSEEKKHAEKPVIYQANETELFGTQDEPTKEETFNAPTNKETNYNEPTKEETFNAPTNKETNYNEPTSGETKDNGETAYDEPINGETVCNGPTTEDTNYNEPNGEVFYKEYTTNRKTIYNQPTNEESTYNVQINGNNIYYEPINRQTVYNKPTNGETTFNTNRALLMLANVAIKTENRNPKERLRKTRNNKRQMGERRVTRSSSKSEDSESISALFNFTLPDKEYERNTKNDSSAGLSFVKLFHDSNSRKVNNKEQQNYHKQKNGIRKRGNKKKDSLKIAKYVIEATSDEITNSTEKSLVINNTRGKKPKAPLNNKDFTSASVVADVLETLKPSKVKTMPWNDKKASDKKTKALRNKQSSKITLAAYQRSLKKIKSSPHQNQIERLSKILKNETPLQKPVTKTRSSTKKLPDNKIQLKTTEGTTFPNKLNNNFIKKQKRGGCKVDPKTNNLPTDDSLVFPPVHNTSQTLDSGQKTKDVPKENQKVFLPDRSEARKKNNLENLIQNQIRKGHSNHFETGPKTPSKSSPKKNSKGLDHIDLDVRNKVKKQHGTRNKNSPTKIQLDIQNIQRETQEIPSYAETHTECNIQKPIYNCHRNLLKNKSTSADSREVSLNRPEKQEVDKESENDRSEILPLQISSNYKITQKETIKIYYFDRPENESRESDQQNLDLKNELSADNKSTCLASNGNGLEIKCTSSKIEETSLNHPCSPNNNMLTKEETQYELLPAEIPQISIFNQLHTQTDYNADHLKDNKNLNLPAETSSVCPKIDEDLPIEEQDVSNSNEIEIESNENLQIDDESLPNYPVSKQEIHKEPEKHPKELAEEPLTETDNTQNQQTVNLSESEPNCSEIELESDEYVPSGTQQVASLSETEMQIDDNMEQKSVDRNPATDEEMEDEFIPSNKLDTEKDHNPEEEIKDNENISKTLPMETELSTSEKLEITVDDKMKRFSIESKLNEFVDCDAEEISSLEPLDNRVDVDKSQIEEIVSERIENPIIEEQTEIISAAETPGSPLNESKEQIREEIEPSDIVTESSTPAIEATIPVEKQTQDQQSLQDDTEIQSNVSTIESESQNIEGEGQFEIEYSVSTNENELQNIQNHEELVRDHIEIESSVHTNENELQNIQNHEELVQDHIEIESSVHTNENELQDIQNQEVLVQDHIEIESSIPTNENELKNIQKQEELMQDHIEIESSVHTNENELQDIQTQEVLVQDHIEIESSIPTNENELKNIQNHEELVQDHIEIESSVHTNVNELQNIQNQEELVKDHIEIESSIPTNKNELQNIQNQEKLIQGHIEIESSVHTNVNELQNIQNQGELVQDHIEIESSIPTNENELQNIQNQEELVQDHIEIECSIPTNENELKNIQNHEELVQDHIEIESSIPTNENELKNIQNHEELVQDHIEIESGIPTNENELQNIQNHEELLQDHMEIECSIPTNENELKNIQNHEELVQDHIEIESGIPTNENELQNIQNHEELLQDHMEIECSIHTNENELQNIQNQEELVQDHIEIESSIPTNENELQNIQNQQKPVQDQIEIESSVPTLEEESQNEFTPATNQGEQKLQNVIEIESFDHTVEDNHQNKCEPIEKPDLAVTNESKTFKIISTSLPTETICSYPVTEQKAVGTNIELFDHPSIDEKQQNIVDNSTEENESDDPSYRNELTVSLANLELQTEDYIIPEVEETPNETVDLHLLKENDFVEEAPADELEFQAEDNIKLQFEDAAPMETTEEINSDNIENEHNFLAEKSNHCVTELKVESIPCVNELEVQTEEFKSPIVGENIEIPPGETTPNYPLADKEQNKTQEACRLEETLPIQPKSLSPTDVLSQNDLSTETKSASETLEDKPQPEHSEENVEEMLPNDPANSEQPSKKTGKNVILSNFVINPSSSDDMITPEAGPAEESSEDSEKPKQKISTSDLIKRLRGRSKTKRKKNHKRHPDSSRTPDTIEMLDASLNPSSREVLEPDSKNQSAKPKLSSPKISTENSDILEGDKNSDIACEEEITSNLNDTEMQTNESICNLQNNEEIVKEVTLDLNNKHSIVEEKTESTQPIQNNELSLDKGFELGESIPNKDEKVCSLSVERLKIETKPVEKYLDHIESKHDNILEQLDAQIKTIDNGRSFSNDLTHCDPAFVHEVEHMINKTLTEKKPSIVERKRKSSTENAGPLCKNCKLNSPTVPDSLSANNFNQQPSLLSNVNCEKLLHDIGLGCLEIFGDDITMIPDDQNPSSISNDKTFVGNDTQWNNSSFIQEITKNFNAQHPRDNEALGNASVKTGTNGINEHEYKTSDPIMSSGIQYQQEFDLFDIGLSDNLKAYKRKDTERYTDWDIDPTNIIVHSASENVLTETVGTWGVEDSLKPIPTSPCIPDSDSQIEIGNEVEIPYDNNSTCSDHMFGTFTSKLPIDAIINDETVSEPWHLQNPVEKPKTDQLIGKSKFIELVNFHNQRQAQNRMARTEPASSQAIPCRQNNKISPRNYRKSTKAKKQHFANGEIENESVRLSDESVTGKISSPQQSPKDHKMYSKPLKDCPSKDDKSYSKPSKEYPPKDDSQHSGENPRTTNLYDTVKSRKRQAAKQAMEKPRETRRSTPTSPPEKSKISNGYTTGLPDLSEACGRTPPPSRDRGKTSSVMESRLDDLKMKISVTEGAAKYAGSYSDGERRERFVNNNSDFDRLLREGNKNPYLKLYNDHNSHNSVPRNQNHESPYRNYVKPSNRNYNNRNGNRPESSNSYWSTNEDSSRSSRHSNCKQPKSTTAHSPSEQNRISPPSNKYFDKSCLGSQTKTFEELHQFVQEQVKRSRKNNPHTHGFYDGSQYD